jgi:hypothetical protein
VTFSAANLEYTNIWVDVTSSAHDAVLARAGDIATGTSPASARPSTATIRRTPPFWAALHAAGADVILQGHDHAYERYPALAANGVLDSSGPISCSAAPIVCHN